MKGMLLKCAITVRHRKQNFCLVSCGGSIPGWSSYVAMVSVLYIYMCINEISMHFYIPIYKRLSDWTKNLHTFGFCIENRQRGRLAGFSLYVSNTGDIRGSTLCYKDGPQLPPLNFTTECIESGRYVIFYNERLAGVTYPSGYEPTNVFTELCEVIVKGIFCITCYLIGFGSLEFMKIDPGFFPFFEFD